MTTANTVFAGPVEVVRPLMAEAVIKAGETLVGGMLVKLDAGEFAAADADVGGDVKIIDMDTIGQKAVGATLTVGQTHPAFIPQVGYKYNLVLAASQTIAKGASLTSSGAGAVKADAGDGSTEPLFVADEAVTTTGATGRIRAIYNPTGVNALA
jgi:hypothetical protein